MPRRQRLWLIILLVLSAVLLQSGLAATVVCLAADAAAVRAEGERTLDQDFLGLDGRLRVVAIVGPAAPAASQVIPTVSFRVINLQIRSSVLTHSPPAHS